MTSSNVSVIFQKPQTFCLCNIDTYTITVTYLYNYIYIHISKKINKIRLTSLLKAYLLLWVLEILINP